MTSSRTAATVGLAAIIALALAGCSSGGESGGTDDNTAKPTATASSSAPADDSDAAAEGDIVEPGATIEAGEWITYDYEDYDGNHAVIQSRVTGITAATEEQLQLLISEIPDLEGYEVSLITLEERKVSGDDITFGSDYTDYSPAATDGAEAQEVSVIGWDECSSESFTEEFNAGSASITSCFVGAVVPGTDKIGGLLYEGPSAAEENPYSSYEGKPVFMKG
jgi:hypothetical protein